MHEISSFHDLGAAERLALVYASGAVKACFMALLMVDAHLRGIAVVPREAMLTQVRLAWWREALSSPSSPATNAHPVLRAAVSAFGERKSILVALVDAWEAVAVGEERGDALTALASARAALCSAIAPAARREAVQAHCAVWSEASALQIGKNARNAHPNLKATRLPSLPRELRPLAVLAGLARRSLLRGDGEFLGDRLSPLAAIRLGIFGR